MQSNDDEILDENLSSLTSNIDLNRMKLNVDEFLRKKEANFELIRKNGKPSSPTNVNELVFDETESERFSHSSEIDKMYELMKTDSKSCYSDAKFDHEIRRDFEKYKLIMTDIFPV